MNSFKNIRHILISAVSIICLILPSCRSTKNTSKTIKATDISASENLQERFSSLIKSYGEWTDISMPFKMSMDTPKNITVSGRATLIRNKSITLSFRVMGFEVAKLFINKDSIFALEKINNRYIAESLQSLQKDFPVTIDEIQDLLLGKPTQIMASVTKNGPEYKRIDKNNWEIEYVEPLTYNYLLNSANFLTGFNAENKKNKVHVNIGYSNHFISEHGNYPSSANINIYAKDKKYNIEMTWSSASAKWNTGAVSTWNTPRGFKKLSVDNLINIFSEQ